MTSRLPVVLNGMTVSSSPGTNFTFSIDAPPFFSPLQGIDGTTTATGRVVEFDAFGPDETWLVEFFAPVSAWRAHFRNAGDPPLGNLKIDVFDATNSLLGTLSADPSSDVEFLGFVLDMGELADHLVFPADPAESTPSTSITSRW
ncbi:MAG: hypothetical protein ACRD3V_01590 [Vicinamibacteria bacterium]